MCERREVRVYLDRELGIYSSRMMEEWFDGFWRGAGVFFGLGIMVGGMIAKLWQWWG
jgi:hypothetical protein